MKQQYSKLLLVIFLLLSAPQAFAQLKGVITDSISHEPLMYISVFYEGKGVGGISNANGEYKVETRKGWNELTFSAVGYITKKVKIPAGAKELNVVLYCRIVFSGIFLLFRFYNHFFQHYIIR